jgi:hypothetical protein
MTTQLARNSRNVQYRKAAFMPRKALPLVLKRGENADGTGGGKGGGDGGGDGGRGGDGGGGGA